MTPIAVFRKVEGLASPMRPWLLGVPAFFITFLVLLWFLGRLASWIFVVLRANK
jgi:hypothetical protein